MLVMLALLSGAVWVNSVWLGLGSATIPSHTVLDKKRSLLRLSAVLEATPDSTAGPLSGHWMLNNSSVEANGVDDAIKPPLWGIPDVDSDKHIFSADSVLTIFSTYSREDSADLVYVWSAEEVSGFRAICADEREGVGLCLVPDRDA